jgi:tRNA(Arg) A34 adenosine deaminase TadA
VKAESTTEGEAAKGKERKKEVVANSAKEFSRCVRLFPSYSLDILEQKDFPLDELSHPIEGLDYGKLGSDDKEFFDAIFVLTAYTLAAANSIASMGEDESNTVGVVIVKPNGKILSWGIDKTTLLHGEVVAVKRWLKATSDSTANSLRLYTSLQPCQMCAGLLRTIKDSGISLQVVFGQNDSGVSGGLPTFLMEIQQLENPFDKVRYWLKDEKFAERLDARKIKREQINPKSKGYMNFLHDKKTQRRLAKAGLRLATIAVPYMQRDDPDGVALLEVWHGAINLLSKATRSQNGFFEQVLTYLDTTRKPESREKTGKFDYLGVLDK